MAPSKIRKAIGAVKDQTSIGLAKVTGTSSLSDLEVAVIKATRHEEYPPDERHVFEILTLTTYSHALVSACVAIIAKRLNRTKNWVVALKTLVLVHRLLTKGDRRAYEREIFFATRRSTRFLNMSDFRDASAGKPDALDYSAFVRTYAMYLDERLEFRMQGRRGRGRGYGYHRDEDEEEGGRHGGGTATASEDEVVRPTPVREMKNESVFSRAHHLKQLLERFLACRPTGAAKHNRVVVVALYPIVKESFQLYYDITEITGTLIDRFMQLRVSDMVRVHEIFCRVSKQFDQLDAFYDWCKTVGIVRSSECPKVEEIPQKKLDMMDDFIHQKSAMLHSRRARRAEPKPDPVEKTINAEPQEGMRAVERLPLPPPEGFVEDMKENKLKEKTDQEIGDLLSLSDDLPSTQEKTDKFALALFGTASESATTTPWEAFRESSGDWETALVRFASRLSNQKASFTGGFDTMTLDSMYQHGAMTTFSSPIGTGSASSVALGSVRRPAPVLALPAPGPAASCGVGNSLPPNTDPFAASLAIAPPVYVQMSEMEKKRRLLVEEQLVWQQYARYGMQGHVGLPNVQQQNSYQYVTGGYARTW